MLELVTISVLKFESDACVMKRRKLLLHVSSSLVLIFHFSCFKRLVGKNSSTANLVVTCTTACIAEILELCSKPLGQPQVDKQG